MAILRGLNPADILPVAKALHAGGLRLLEITLNSPAALDAIEALTKNFSSEELLIGAGTVMDEKEAQQAMAAGASFIISPHTDAALIRATREGGAVSIPGAFTPTEIVQAWRFGGQIIKVFPAGGGLSYFRELRAPLNLVPLMPTGGIHAGNIAAFRDAGAVAFGIGSALVKMPFTVSDDSLKGITENTKELVQALTV